MTANGHEQREGAATPLSPQILTAAAWLSEHWHVAPQPVTRYLRESYGLAFNDAVKAMAEARRIHDRGSR